MTRKSKPERRRAVSPKRRRQSGPKTGPKKDNLPQGYKELANAVEGELATQVFFPRVR